jgi:hypothetical protein
MIWRVRRTEGAFLLFSNTNVNKYRNAMSTNPAIYTSSKFSMPVNHISDRRMQMASVKACTVR